MGLDFRQTWLWQQSFVQPRLDASREEQEYFREQFLQMREKVGYLSARIATDMPSLTVHDLTHLDSLWETASLVAEGSISVSPPEAFVLGASFLLHDAGMAVAAYPGGLAEIKETIQWKDAATRWLQSRVEEQTDPNFDITNVTMEAEKQILPEVLRRLHAQQAEAIAEQPWSTKDGEQQYLISESDLRFFYGPTIGEIAHSHWWNVQKLEHFSQDLGAFPQKTRNLIDRVKLACLLRIADALHLDQLRAPRFLRTLARPEGIAALHWGFQEKLARPHIEGDAVVFTVGHPFERSDSEAWWLAYETLSLVDRELRDVDLLLQSRGRETLRARRVKGIGSPEAFSKIVTTRNWRPVDARIHVSDVPRIIESLGGAKLYGHDPLVPIRELIQNSADAVQARRRFQNRAPNWGEIKVAVENRTDGTWLLVEDNGIGMSEQVLTGPLIDFGTSFWRSPMALEEFPGLAASGMNAIGRFGIGFFSIFMLGGVVRVSSRRCDRGDETARVLEIKGGPAGHPNLWPAKRGEAPLDGGTRVEVLLEIKPIAQGGILWAGKYSKQPLVLERLVASLAPSLDVELYSGDQRTSCAVVRPADWLAIPDSELLRRLDASLSDEKASPTAAYSLQPLIGENGKIYGRAAIVPETLWSSSRSGYVTISGLRANSIRNVSGILTGEPITAARNFALPDVPREVLATWATKQSQLLLNAKRVDEYKSKGAEVILRCGGDIGLLPIALWNDEWLSSDQFLELISDKDELFINFGLGFDYDEDTDSMHPRDFKDNLIVSEDIIQVVQHDGTIVRGDGLNWPDLLYPDSPDNHLEALVKQLIVKAWGNYERVTTEVVVGVVGIQDVIRPVDRFTRIVEEDDGQN